MDCNRDEAQRSKEIAEKRFMQKDYSGAHKFALKARRLFPQLEGVEQLVSVLDVHIHAASGHVDWYGILQSEPSADDALLRKQFRKLALMLHPDKNKSVGAESAFKLISEAWSVLSDKNKKMAYDMKRSSMGITKPAKPPSPPPPPPPPPVNVTTKNQNIPRHDHKAHVHSPTSQNPLPATFWTACPLCKLQFEYLLVYKNKNLCCPICYKPFVAQEIVAVNGTTVWPLQEQKGTNNVNGCAKVRPSSRCDVPGLGDLNSSSQVKVEGRKENIEVHQPPSMTRKEEMKRTRKQLKAKVKAHAKETISRLVAKSKEVIEQNLSSVKAASKGTAAGSDTIHGQKRSGRMRGSIADNCVPKSAASSNGKVEVSESTPSVEKRSHHHCEMQQAAASPAKKSRLSYEGSTSEGAPKEIAESLLANNAHVLGRSVECHTTALKDKPNVDVFMTCPPSVSKAGEAPLASVMGTSNHLNVPDSEFYVFDKDRTEHHFSAGQIWACYDDGDECFPRYYACVQKVISRHPFKINYAWLEAQSSLNGNVLPGLKAGSSYTCGEFKLGEMMTSLSINMFSHVVAFETVQNETFKIYPRKGEVWALYKECEKTLKRKDGYDLVEVVTDYSDESGVQVAILAKVEGYKAIFQRQFGQAHWVLPEEMMQLCSHSIPAHQLAAGEVPILLEGCWELDPASIPYK